jgi:hypothetical protein
MFRRQFITLSERAKLAESHNSTGVRRLPRAERARRIDGVGIYPEMADPERAGYQQP